MQNTEIKLKPSKPVSLLLLIPAFLFGLISMALAIVGLGLIPLLPALAGIILCGVSLLIFKRSYRSFTIVVISISIIASVVSVFRGVIIEKKVADDKTFDSTMVKTQEGVDSDLNEALQDDIFGTEMQSDSVTVIVK